MNNGNNSTSFPTEKEKSDRELERLDRELQNAPARVLTPEEEVEEQKLVLLHTCLVPSEVPKEIHELLLPFSEAFNTFKEAIKDCTDPFDRVHIKALEEFRDILLANPAPVCNTGTLKTLAALATISILGTTAHAQSVDSTSMNHDKQTPKTEKVSPLTDKKFHVSPGYNAVEAGMTSEPNLRTRALTNIDFSFHGVEVGYHALNEFTKDLKGYFGRHVMTAGWKDFDLKLASVIKTGADGVLDATFGLRYKISGKISDKTGLYGFVDVTADKDGGNATIFLGKSLGKGPSIELFEAIDAGFNGEMKFYTELQLNQQITKGLQVFVRGEMVAAKYKETVFILGVLAPIK